MTFARSLCATLCSPCLGSEYIPPSPHPHPPQPPGRQGAIHQIVTCFSMLELPQDASAGLTFCGFGCQP